jgi:hypothetical protein
MTNSNFKLTNSNTIISSTLTLLNSSPPSKISSPPLIKLTLNSITQMIHKNNSSSWAVFTIASQSPNSKINPQISHNLVNKPTSNCPTLHSKNPKIPLKTTMQPNSLPTNKMKIKVLIFVLVDSIFTLRLKMIIQKQHLIIHLLETSLSSLITSSTNIF